MPRKKVSGIAARFGARYGASLRKRWKKVMEARYSIYRCPLCGAETRMKRIAIGIWQCPKCGATWAGAAYTPWTIETSSKV